MDAAEEDQDILLQRSSPELLADLQSSLKPFLWKTTSSGKTQIRKRVRVRETDRLVNLLEPFQELPQLLDPHLDKLVPVLADAFLAFLRSNAAQQATAPTQLLTPLSSAICRLLYTFCKIRGEKVIVRFFSTETRHLELLLSAIEDGSRDQENLAGKQKYKWEWEERYITLLWLSQLLLAPFDLSTISSAGTITDDPPQVDGLLWPPQTPGVTFRVIPLAIRYLSSSGKERDAAKVLLVRVAMRRDMQAIGILHALVQWTLSSLRPSADVEHPTYFYIGVLSFLAGLLSSSTSTADMSPYLPAIFERVQEISGGTNPAFITIHSLAIARKTIIKVLRTISILALQVSGSTSSADMVEGTIGTLLESLGDPATPVRLAASKALSLITLKLSPDLADQVIEAVLQSLEVNVTWVRGPDGQKVRRDLSRVNPFEWHGLILTLSHLLYRHSPPTSTLSQIIPALFLGLSFEQRSTTGASVGTNVRDAACFGIWALARRYRTEELQGIKLESGILHESDNEVEVNASVLQKLATRLVVSASLDPAGNIRRGSSAALQELIGRHPNTIEEGISVVQVVDYHAVALRSRAIQQVGVQAALLSEHYRLGLLNDLLGWRGVQDADVNVRNNTANAVESIVLRGDVAGVTTAHSAKQRDTVARISKQIRGLALRDMEERHGLLLCLASIYRDGNLGIEGINIVADLLEFLNGSFSRFRGTELLAEAASRLIFAVSSSLVAPQPGPSGQLDMRMRYINNLYAEGASPHADFLHAAGSLLEKFMPINDTLCVEAISVAAADFLTMVTREKRRVLITQWRTKVEDGGRNSSPPGNVYLHTLFKITRIATPQFTDLPDEQTSTSLVSKIIGAVRRTSTPQSMDLDAKHSSPSLVSKIIATIQNKWNSPLDSESRAALLRCLAASTATFTHTKELLFMITEGLDDYTTNARGDVGSFVRVEAAKAVSVLWQHPNWEEDTQRAVYMLIGRMLRLAAEKLDKVRLEGQRTLVLLLKDAEQAKSFKCLPTSSAEYFKLLLELKTNQETTSHNSFKIQPSTQDWQLDLLQGFVTSADTGSEDLVRASRAALAGTLSLNSTDQSWIPSQLIEVMKTNRENDRVLVPTMEVLSFLLDIQLFPQNLSRTLFLQTQKAHFKTGNVRKLEAAVKLYSGLSEVADVEERKLILRKLSSMLLHPFPKVRNAVVEELWCRFGVGKGVSWVKASKGDLERLRGELEELERAE